MSLTRPIFIIGTGRCGSTIFHEIFTHHPRVAFLSGLCMRYPRQPRFNRWAMRVLDAPLLHRFARRKFRPAEHWPFWEEHCRGFSMPFRDLLASDVTPEVKTRLARVLEGMVTRRRRRLLVKLSGWPRTGFLSEIFPDALFIHLVRDGRAVANSLLSADFWLGHRGPCHWQWGDLSPTQQLIWEQSGKSFVSLAGIQWQIVMDAFEKARKPLPISRYFEIKYEDLVADPKAVFGEVLSFCQLDYPRQFKDAIDSFELVSKDFKWKEQLTGPQREQLEAVLADDLVRWGYDPAEKPRARLEAGCNGAPVDESAWSDESDDSFDCETDDEGSSVDMESFAI
jgi:hypothetical protein